MCREKRESWLEGKRENKIIKLAVWNEGLLTLFFPLPAFVFFFRLVTQWVR